MDTRVLDDAIGRRPLATQHSAINQSINIITPHVTASAIFSLFICFYRSIHLFQLCRCFPSLL